MLTRTGGREAPEVVTGSLYFTTAAVTSSRPTLTTSGGGWEVQGKKGKNTLGIIIYFLTFKKPKHMYKNIGLFLLLCLIYIWLANVAIRQDMFRKKNITLIIF